MKEIGSGAADNVVGAATHALVLKGWNIAGDSTESVISSLSQSSPNVLDEVDRFFSALRIATGLISGYAQIVWVPNKWALSYFCDLTPVVGFKIRRYPGEYDNYGWVRQGAVVSAQQLGEVRRIYGAIVASTSEALRLSLRRLNACLTRTDAADAILDATIGLELLLGDDDHQSLSYKLRLRAGALARLHQDPTKPAHEIFSRVKRLYEVRSSIVHGRRRKASRKVSEAGDTSHTEERKDAAELLRFILDVLLTESKYLDSSRIDKELLLGGDSDETLE